MWKLQIQFKLTKILQKSKFIKPAIFNDQWIGLKLESIPSKSIAISQRDSEDSINRKSISWDVHITHRLISTIYVLENGALKDCDS